MIVALRCRWRSRRSRRVDARDQERGARTGRSCWRRARPAGSVDRCSSNAVGRSRADLGGRVIVVGPRGACSPTPRGRGPRVGSYASRPEIARALAGRPDQGRGTATRSTRSLLSPRCLWSGRPHRRRRARDPERGRASSEVRRDSSPSSASARWRSARPWRGLAAGGLAGAAAAASRGHGPARRPGRS